MLVAALCLSSVACNRVSTPAVARIPLMNCSGFPCIEATFGGTKLRLLISLADQNSFLTSLGTVKADAKRPPKEVGKARKFKIGSVEVNDLFTSDNTFHGAFPEGADKLTPPVDGTLSYNAFGERLLILNIPGKYIEVSEQPLTQPACPANCSQLRDSRTGDMGGIALTTDGFSVDNLQLRARLDTLFQGSIAILEHIQGLRTQATAPSEGSYAGSKLSLLETAPVYFGGKTVANPAPVVRADPAFGIVGREYNSAVGLSILSTSAYGFDLRSMKMWRYE